LKKHNFKISHPFPKGPLRGGFRNDNLKCHFNWNPDQRSGEGRNLSYVELKFK